MLLLFLLDHLICLVLGFFNLICLLVDFLILFLNCLCILFQHFVGFQDSRFKMIFTPANLIKLSKLDLYEVHRDLIAHPFTQGVLPTHEVPLSVKLELFVELRHLPVLLLLKLRHHHLHVFDLHFERL